MAKNLVNLEFLITYKNEKFPDGKSNAMGWMHYIIGYARYYKLNQKDETIKYFKKAIECNSEVRNFKEIADILR